MTMLDSDLLELFLHEQIVPLWEQSGWMTAKYDQDASRRFIAHSPLLGKSSVK